MNRHTIVSPIRLAMEKSIANMRSTTGAYGHHVKRAVQRGVGTASRSDWNAHLSHRTAQSLIKQDILPH